MKKGWQKTSLSDLFDVGSSKRVLKSQWKTSGVPFYRGREITRLALDGSVENELFVSEKHFAELSQRYGVPKSGDIMITAIGTIGNTHVVRAADKFYFKDASVLWMKRETDLSSEYVNYWLKSPLFFDQLDRGNGATVDTLTINKLKSLEINLPPLAEQQRIVGILDEAFAGLATAKATAEKNLQNARALFESHLQSVFSQHGPLASLSDLADEVTDGDHSPPPKAPTGVPFITISDIDKRRGTIDFSNTFTVPEAYFRGLKPSKKPRVGDVLYTVTGATLGIPILVREQRDFCFQRHIGLIRPNANTDSSWLTYALRSPQVFRQATVGSTGAAQKTVSLGVLRNLQLPKVKLTEQKLIAAKLDALSTETQRLASLYQQKLLALEALKKSLLHQAFSGAL